MVDRRRHARALRLAAVAAGAGAVALAAACRSRDTRPLELASARGVVLDPYAREPPPGYDPLALAVASKGRVSNEAATVPPACYTRTEGRSNPCWACHTRSHYPNLANDWELQQNYAFPPEAMTNPWRNLFRDRARLVERFDEAAVLAYVRTDNYGPLRAALATRPAGPTWFPDLDLAAGFDEAGFARDGTGWRALRYKPFLGTFWPTNGSTDDVYVRLPPAFQRDRDGQPSRAVYEENLAILERAIASDPRPGHEPELPDTYAGGACEVRVVRGLYPIGVELFHTVRYLDPDAPGLVARRLKEVRYARKVAMVEHLGRAEVHEHIELGKAPVYRGDPVAGLRNDLGWLFQGWIEDAGGWLRLQTHEEQAFCMGCHTTIGVTVDGTFALPRKLPGAAGWRVQDVRGIPDRPQLGHTAPEYATYLARVGGGDELRANDEVLARFFRDGAPDPAAVARFRDDISVLVLPSRERAIALDRAYLANVIEQSYIWGRDAVIAPVKHVHARIVERSTGIGEAGRTARDGVLPLAWDE